MKILFLITIVAASILFLANSQNSCSFTGGFDDSTPKRLVIIKGKATILNHPQLGETPYNTGTIIFQKLGCNSCFVGAETDSDGNYNILVGDGKYKVMVRNPASPEDDMLAPQQERFIETVSPISEQQVFNFNVNIELPKSE